MSKNKVPIVAIVGRANVGKSSLFNAIVGHRQAIVADEPGTTRDSIMAKASVMVREEITPGTKSFSHLDGMQEKAEQQTEAYHEYADGVVQDLPQQSAKRGSGRAGSASRQTTLVQKDFWLVDTAGIKDAEDDFEFTIQEQITQAADSADIICVVVEADIPVIEEDRRVAKLALKSKKPVLLVVNKADKNRGVDLSTYQKLGIKPIIATSSTQRTGIEDLLQTITKDLPKASIGVADDRIRVAILGRPNMGKSQLFNTLAKKQQAIVADRAGTTRDVNSTVVKFMGREVELLDTAGIRKNGKIEVGIERFSVIRALSAIERADVCLLLMDVNELGVQLDQKLAGLVKEAGKGLILVVSKWDSVIDKDAYTRDAIAPQIQQDFEFVPWAPLIFTSSVTGHNVSKIFELVVEIEQNRTKKISTPALNKWLRDCVNAHPPAGLKNSHPKLNYIVQTEESTPNFKVFGSHTGLLHWSYKRYLDRELRKTFGFEGTAVKFWFIPKNIDRHKLEKET